MAIERRGFLKTALGGAAAVTGFPTIIPSSALGADGTVAPSEKIVMGFIGVGGMGGGHVRGFLQHADVRAAAICDLREDRRLAAKQVVDEQYGDKSCATYNDFRELLALPHIDAVLIAVPDHWHALVGIEAARRGKHMYYEKPMGVSIAASKAVRAAVKRHGVVFQFGTQQRSDQGYRHTCELIRNGRIGELKTVMIGSAGGSPSTLGNQPVQPVPPGFDYDMWLGPAPWAPYTFERCTRNFTLIYDYSLGCIGGAWGVHDTDIAQWVADADGTGPVETEGWGLFPKEGMYDTAYSWEVEHRYASGVRVIHMDIQTAKKRASQFTPGSMASVMFGSEGWIYVSRQGMRTHPESLMHEVIGPNEKKVIRSNDHRRNFLNAVRTGQQPISPIDAAVRSDILCHHGDIAMRLERKVRWDPVKEEFIGDEQATRMMDRSMRSPWRV